MSTGDFTHPAWIRELEEKLQPAGNGFYTLKHVPELKELPERLQPQNGLFLFVYGGELRIHYKRQQYKNHHLIYAPDFETGGLVNKALSRYGDLSLDGRPTCTCRHMNY